MILRCKIAVVTAAAVVSAALLLTPGTGLGQAPQDEKAKAKAAAKAKEIAQIFEQNARELVIYDRQGKVVGTVGPKAIYSQPVFSPDAKRIAVVNNDVEKETADIWVLDVASGDRKQITTSEAREGASAPVWSPDGQEI